MESKYEPIEKEGKDLLWIIAKDDASAIINHSMDFVRKLSGLLKILTNER
jgi:ABC-type uncharacterized transport system ATPase subunit